MLINLARGSMFDIPLMFATLLTIALVGIALYLVVVLVERRLVGALSRSVVHARRSRVVQAFRVRAAPRSESRHRRLQRAARDPISVAPSVAPSTVPSSEPSATRRR